MTLREGSATAQGTARYRRRAVEARHLPDAHFRETASGLHLSSLGLGTYLGRPDGPTDLAVEEAVRVAVSSGRINVIDTAINYRYQRAERSIGRALSGLFEGKGVSRDEVFVATKVGYFAPDGELGLAPEEWVERELIGPGILDPADVVDACHAMSPSYLKDQVERSRRNLGLATLDLLYLHNAPDTQLPVVGAGEFRRRLAEAFEVLESLRAGGALGAYGLATWDSLRAPPGAPGYLSVEEALAVAAEVGGPSHGLRFLQFPFNLAMLEAMTLRNQPTHGANRTLFDCARHHRLGCFTSIPLVQGQLARTGPSWEGLSRAQTAIQFARSVPGTVAPLVGQKQPTHLSENLRVAELPPLSTEGFRTRCAELGLPVG